MSRWGRVDWQMTLDSRNNITVPWSLCILYSRLLCLARLLAALCASELFQPLLSGWPQTALDGPAPATHAPLASLLAQKFPWNGPTTGQAKGSWARREHQSVQCQCRTQLPIQVGSAAPVCTAISPVLSSCSCSCRRVRFFFGTQDGAAV